MAERVPYHGLTLSECHSGKLEMILTNFVVTQMQTEGSTFYRAEAVTAVGQVEVIPTNVPVTTAVRTNARRLRPKSKNTAKGKPQPKPRPEPANAQEEEAEGGDGNESPVLPW